jgi:hypothetical protein
LIRPPPDFLRAESPDLWNWLNELWSYVTFSSPFIWKESLADDAFVDLPDSVQGFGFAFAGDFDEWIFFTNTAAAAVTILTDTNGDTLNSTNGVATDTDAKFCVFDNGTNVRVRNRLAATKEVFVVYYYYP